MSEKLTRYYDIGGRACADDEGPYVLHSAAVALDAERVKEIERLTYIVERACQGAPLDSDDDRQILVRWRDSVIARACRAGLKAGVGLCDWFEALSAENAALRAQLAEVRADEREACVELCELTANYGSARSETWKDAARECANAIRSRTPQPPSEPTT